MLCSIHKFLTLNPKAESKGKKVDTAVAYFKQLRLKQFFIIISSRCNFVQTSFDNFKFEFMVGEKKSRLNRKTFSLPSCNKLACHTSTLV
jgi:hypothetical protein